MISGYGVTNDFVETFGERACMRGGLGIIVGNNVMPLIINIAGKACLIGG